MAPPSPRPPDPPASLPPSLSRPTSPSLSLSQLGDLPPSPTSRAQFFSVHEQLVNPSEEGGVGARLMQGVEGLEEECRRDEEERAREAAEQQQQRDGFAMDRDLAPHLALVLDISPSASPPPPVSDDPFEAQQDTVSLSVASGRQSASTDTSGEGSAEEVERALLLPSTQAFQQQNGREKQQEDKEDKEGESNYDVARQLARALAAQADEEEGMDDDDLDGVPIHIPDETMEPLGEDEGMGGEGEASKGGKSSEEEGDESPLRLLASTWLSRVPSQPAPSYWLFYAPSRASPSSPTASSGVRFTPGRPLGCTLTLSLPDGSQRAFTAPPAEDGARDRKAAKNAAARVALQARVVEEAERMVLSLEAGGGEGAKGEKEEKEKGKEKAWAETVDRPYDVLVQAWQRWMPVEAMRWAFETDELNTTHGCVLVCPISPTSPTPELTFRAPSAPSQTSHRTAKDAAARLALSAGVPRLWEDAFKARLRADSGGYLVFGDESFASIAARANAGAEGAEGEEGEGEGGEGADGRDGGQGERDRVDPVRRLGQEVRRAFGGIAKWVEWAHKAGDGGDPASAPTSSSASAPKKTAGGHALLSATLTLTFPSTSRFPSPPPTMTWSVPAAYHTKHHAFMALALLALREGVVERLRPYVEEREDEAERKKVEKARERNEKKDRERERTVPEAGSVKWEELEALERPSEYLNLCAQQWTGNGSPLKFAYEVVPTPGGKQHGCALSVYISPTLTKVYTIHPSEATTTRRDAKDAAVRLALRERVLDLMRPATPPSLTLAGDTAKDVAQAPSEAGKAKKGKDKDKAAKKEQKKKAKPARDAALPYPPPSRSAPPFLTGSGVVSAREPQSAVEYLDRVCGEWLGPEGAPRYDVRQDATGLFGAVLRIPLPRPSTPPLTHPSGDADIAYWVAFAHPTRAAAQEAVADLAVRDGVDECIRREVGGRRCEGAGERAERVFGGGRGAVPAVQPVVEGSGQQGVKRAAPTPPTPVTDSPDGSGADAAPAAKKPRVEGAAATDEQQEAVESDKSAADGDDKPYATLRAGLIAALGDEAAVRPVYRVVEQGSSFGATVTIPLSAVPSDTRTFTVPASFPSKRSARTAAASAALRAGALELIESRARVPRVPTAKEERKRREKEPVVERSREEQEVVCRAAYGGMGAAGGDRVPLPLPMPVKPVPAAKPAAQAAAETALPAQTARKDDANGGGKEKTSNAAAVKGEAVLALEAHCTSHALPPPAFSRSSSSGKLRVWTIVQGLRFELPNPPVEGAEERLAVKVLRHLEKLEECEARGKKA
ncbi:hypothetical protein JCM10207_002142 [Rhodosporidiobolus poonsookiae]